MAPQGCFPGSFFMGKELPLGHSAGMSTQPQPDDCARMAAEEVLRTLYGDDLAGCPVPLDTIAVIIGEAARQKDRQTDELLNLYEKVVEAVQVLSTPPDAAKISDPKDLQALLTQRLDQIHMVATRTIATTAPFRPRPEGPAAG